MAQYKDDHRLGMNTKKTSKCKFVCLWRFPQAKGKSYAWAHITKIGRTVRGLSDPPHHRRRYSVRGPIV